MDERTEELTAAIQEIRDRVRARHPNGNAPGGVPLANLIPLVHARDAAEGKVASIGTVNPRPPGLKNSVIQWAKGLVARALDWHVREQVEFNRAVMNCVQAAMEALNETNRAISTLTGKLEPLQQETSELKDIRSHWAEWRREWERRLASNEAHFLRSVSELQASWQHRVTLLDETHREQMKSLHTNFQAALDRSATEIQQKLWADMDRIRSEYESIIHAELRLLRQKASMGQPHSAQGPIQHSEPAAALDQIDWLKFAEKFRGAEEYVKEHQRMYAQHFAGASEVLDIGCGRGELLQVLQEAGVSARGIDLNEDCLALCRAKNLQVEKADLFEHLMQLPENSLGGIVCAQVVEHLPPERLPDLVRLAQSKLKRGALLAMETPNPECLAIFATHFYLDPTHTRPIPPALMEFYFEEAGLGRIEAIRLYPAVETMPSLRELPDDFRKQFFGSLDYVVFGRKL